MAAPTIPSGQSGVAKSAGTNGTTTPAFTLPGSGVLAGVAVVGIAVKNIGFTWSSLPSGWSELTRATNATANLSLVILSGPISAGQSGTLSFVMSGTAMWEIDWALVPDAVVLNQNIASNGGTAGGTHNQCTLATSPYAEVLEIFFLGMRASTTSATSTTPISNGPSGSTLLGQENTAISGQNNTAGGLCSQAMTVAGTTNANTWTTSSAVWFSISAVVTLVHATQTVSPSGLASAEAFGSATITATGGVQTISPSSLASAEAFGSATLSTGPVTVSPAGLASAEAFGSATVNNFNTVLPTGIATAEAFGSATLAVGAATVSPSGIASAEAFGTPFLSYLIFMSFENGTSSNSVLTSVPTDGSLPFDTNALTGPGTESTTLDSSWAHLGSLSFKSAVSGSTSASAGWSSAVLPSLQQHVVFRSYHHWSGTPVDKSRLFTIRDTGGGYLAVRLNSNGSVDISDVQAGTSLASSSAGLFNLIGQQTARCETHLDLTSGGSGTVTIDTYLWLASGAGIESTGTADIHVSATLSAVHTDCNSIYYGLVYPSGANSFAIYTDDIAVREQLTSTLIGPLTSVQAISAAGAIASGEAFGSDTFLAGAVTISPSGVATAEAFGSDTVSVGPVTLSPTAIGSAEAFGTASFARGPVSVLPTAIGSAEAFGTAVFSAGAATVSPSGIASSEALGSAGVSPGPVVISPPGAGSGEAFGSATLTNVFALHPTGITSAEAFGADTFTVGPITLLPSGVVSGEAFGADVVGVGLVSLLPTGVISAETFGTPQLNQQIYPAGVASAETFGSDVVQSAYTITGTGISSAEVFGVATLHAAYTISPAGIASGEAFGVLTVSPGPVTVSPTGVVSGEALGNPAVTTGVVTISPPGIASSETFGAATAHAVYTFTPTGIASSETFGTTIFSVGPITVSPSGIASSGAFGTTIVGIVFFHTFEGGTAGTSVIGLDPGDGSSVMDISQITGTGSTVTIDTLWSHLGTRSLKSTTTGGTAASAGWSATVLGELGQHVLTRSYHHWTAIPPDKSRLFTFRDSGGGYIAPRINSDGSIDVVDVQAGTVIAASAAAQFPVTVAHQITARCECDLDLTAGASGTVTLTVRMWYSTGSGPESTGTPDTTLVATLSATHTAMDSMYVGLTYPTGGGQTMTIWTDDFAIRAQSSAGQIGPLVPPPQFVSVNSVGSAEVFGTAVLTPANTISAAGALGSNEAFGQPVISTLRSLFPSGVGSNEFFGTTIVLPGPFTMLPSGIVTAEVSGHPSVTVNGQIAGIGIASAEVFGATVLLPGPVGVSPSGIVTAEALGAPALSALAKIFPFGIITAEAFGLVAVRGNQGLHLVGIVSAEAFGIPDLINRNFRFLLVHVFPPVLGVRVREPFTRIERTGAPAAGTAVGYPRRLP